MENCWTLAQAVTPNSLLRNTKATRTKQWLSKLCGMETRLGNLELDLERFELRIAGRRVELTYTEFTLLQALMERPGRVVLQEELVEAVWGDTGSGEGGRLRVQMSRLRKKLEGSKPWVIRTVLRRGYALADLSEGASEERSEVNGRSGLKSYAGGQAW